MLPEIFEQIIFHKSFFLNLFLYLFLAVLGLRFCARAFSSCSERGPLFIAVHRPLTIAASLVGEHRFQTRRLSSCGSRAQLLRGMWDLPGPGLEPVSPAFAGRFSTTALPGKPRKSFYLGRTFSMSMRGAWYILSPKAEIKLSKKKSAFTVSGNRSKSMFLRNVYSVKKSGCSLAPLSLWLRRFTLGERASQVDWKLYCPLGGNRLHSRA